MIIKMTEIFQDDWMNAFLNNTICLSHDLTRRTLYEKRNTVSNVSRHDFWNRKKIAKMIVKMIVSGTVKRIYFKKGRIPWDIKKIFCM